MYHRTWVKTGPSPREQITKKRLMCRVSALWLRRLYRSVALLSVVCSLLLNGVTVSQGLPLTENRGFLIDAPRVDLISNAMIGGMSPVLPTQMWGAGLNYDWSYDLATLSLRQAELTSLIDHRVSATLQGWYMPHRRVLVGLEMPTLLYQGRPNYESSIISGGLEGLTSAGLGDVRLNTRFAAYQRTHWQHTLDIALSIPTATLTDYFGEESATLRLSYLAGHLAHLSPRYHLRTHFALSHLSQPNVSWIGQTRQSLSTAHLSTQLRLFSQSTSQPASPSAPESVFTSQAGSSTQALWLGLGLLYRTDLLSTIAETETTTHGLMAHLQTSYEWTKWRVKVYGGRALVYDLTTPRWQAGIALHYQHHPPASPKITKVVTLPPKDPPKVTPQVQDQDQDLIPDSIDQCPSQPGSIQTQGCPRSDLDGDLVTNREDSCPTTPGSKSNQGCPLRELVIPDLLSTPISFAINSSRLSSVARQQLDQLISFLNQHPKLKIHLSGHADPVGQQKYNTFLSKQRLKSVITYIKIRGVNVERISSFAHSENYSRTYKDDYALRAQSRRVTITFIQVKRAIIDGSKRD